MFETALILGNGKSRRNSDLSALIGTSAIYGCNLAYKEDYPFEWIVATDPAIQHQIYREYDGNKLFLDWNSVPSEMAVAFEAFDTMNGSNEYTPHGCVISGEDNTTMMTYLKEDDNCLTVAESQLPFEMSAGSLAMWDAAERGFKTIHLAGFGDVDHLHDQKLMGDDGRRLIRWEQERKEIMRMYDDINWIYL